MNFNTLKKFAQELNNEDFEVFYNFLTDVKEERDAEIIRKVHEKIKYKIMEINNLIEEYDIWENYEFFDEGGMIGFHVIK